MANPPPPYDNITGISRAVMKDNAQETLPNYNGNARPGELVVNLVVDPPVLYVGNNSGQLTAISTGNTASLPLSNGISNFDIATANGNVTITSGLNTWTFVDLGNLYVPDSILGYGDTRLILAANATLDSHITIPSDSVSDLYVVNRYGNIVIETNNGNFSFSNGLEFNDSTVQTTAYIPDTVYNGGSVSGNLTPNTANGSIQKYTLTGNITLLPFTSNTAGQSLTLILTQDGTGNRTLDANLAYLFASGLQTLSTYSNAIDMLNIFYDGTTYYATLTVSYS
jgi:hypothetical protein